MKLSVEQLLEIAQFSFVRMDGAWFMALAGKFGKETAWEMDVDACCEVILSRKTP